MVSDYLLPDYEGLAKIEPLIENFKEKVYSDYACLMEKNRADGGVRGKRGQEEVRNLDCDQKPDKKEPTGVGGAVLKRPRNRNQNLMTEEGEGGGAEETRFVENCILADNCKALKVAPLKAYMEFHKVSTSGRNKADCVNAVRNVMKRNGKF